MAKEERSQPEADPIFAWVRARVLEMGGRCRGPIMGVKVGGWWAVVYERGDKFDATTRWLYFGPAATDKLPKFGDILAMGELGDCFRSGNTVPGSPFDGTVYYRYINIRKPIRDAERAPWEVREQLLRTAFEHSFLRFVQVLENPRDILTCGLLTWSKIGWEEAHAALGVELGEVELPNLHRPPAPGTVY